MGEVIQVILGALFLGLWLYDMFWNRGNKNLPEQPQGPPRPQTLLVPGQNVYVCISEERGIWTPALLEGFVPPETKGSSNRAKIRINGEPFVINIEQIAVIEDHEDEKPPEKQVSTYRD